MTPRQRFIFVRWSIFNKLGNLTSSQALPIFEQYLFEQEMLNEY